MKTLLLLMLLLISDLAMAEGRCPPGQYPVGDERHGVGGCAPIPGGQAQGGAQPSAPVPTGEWETRWGAIAQDAARQSGGNLPIGVSASKKSKREAQIEAISQCRRMGGGGAS